ncbi:MAG: hypothetical protein A3K18_20225 [Lentisphaerae bacterium RIFOXYA12_64_32]|nr:MAG: hypothetical protein A3K18_20225 [Lentisphaerae bacterium RIFOXYA12_64_32]
MTWYVSPDGRDAWSGRVAEIAADKTDGPFATIAAAVEASRRQAAAPRTIMLLPGRHFVDATIELDPRDQDLTLEGAGPGKTTVYGGRRVEGWQRDGEKFWAAALPKDNGKDWLFRLLVIDDAVRPRARLPAEGHFEHETKFPVRWMSTAGGGWERKPTPQELTTLQYRQGDLGEWLSVKNAEVTVYHMWDESTVGVAAHDVATRTLTLASPCGHPPGGFGVQRYAVWNVREGMTQPGQWYLDRDAGRVVYRPRPDEDMTKAFAVAPRLQVLFRIKGDAKKPVVNLTLRRMTLSTTDAPLTSAGFGGCAWPGLISASSGRGLRLAELEIANAGAYAIQAGGLQDDCAVVDCHLHHLGGGGMRVSGPKLRVEGNRIHDIGLLCASAIGLMGGGEKAVVRRNVLHDTPYSGMCFGGTDVVIEENLIYRCMQQLHDGAAIYMGDAVRTIIRRNVVRDIQEHGKGYGLSSYYLDEKCRDCMVEGNVSINVKMPTQNHMTLNCTLRNNLFIAADDMVLSVPRSANYHVLGNTFHVGGKFTVNDPDAVVEWKDNLIVRPGVEPELADALPEAERKLRQTPVRRNVTRVEKPPRIDGRMDTDEWPADGLDLGQNPDQRRARGAPLTARACTDGQALFVTAAVVSMFPEARKLGATWGQDEGAELALEGRRGDGTAVTYVLRGFADGTFKSLTLGGATEDEAAALAKAVTCAAGVEKTIWRCEWAVPLAALRFDPGQQDLLPCNLTVFRSEDAQYIQWAGTLGETWDLTRGGRLAFKGDRSNRAKPTAQALRTAAAPTLDGTAAAGEWPGEPLRLAQTPDGGPLAGTPCAAHVAWDAQALYVHLAVPFGAATPPTRGQTWGQDDGAEVCLRGKLADGKPTTWVVHGFAGGQFEVSTEAGTPADTAQALGKDIGFKATVGGAGWEAEWRLPLTALGIEPKPGTALPFNLGVFRTEDGQWINWVGTSGPTWNLDNAGTLSLADTAKAP